jgi:hypothetical protein
MTRIRKSVSMFITALIVTGLNRATTVSEMTLKEKKSITGLWCSTYVFALKQLFSGICVMGKNRQLNGVKTLKKENNVLDSTPGTRKKTQNICGYMGQEHTVGRFPTR